MTTEFKVGQLVRNQTFGTGVLVAIDTDDSNEYPLVVKFTYSNQKSILRGFTRQGTFRFTPKKSDDLTTDIVSYGSVFCPPINNISLYDWDIIHNTPKNMMFQVGDRVENNIYGAGTIIDIDEGMNSSYPMRVQFDASIDRVTDNVRTFTVFGKYMHNDSLKDYDIRLKTPGFRIGDLVYSTLYGTGVVRDVDSTNPMYPVNVYFTDVDVGEWYTPEGFFDSSYKWTRAPGQDECNIHLISADPEKEESPKNDISMDAINPSHYRVDGIPEAIEIMKGLMTTEQIEGFLWGNILKYAYRYGRKGDKVETAKKIKWYADKLSEIHDNNTNEE